jgi:hypothetical protein
MEHLGWYFSAHSLSWFAGTLLVVIGVSVGVLAGTVLTTLARVADDMRWSRPAPSSIHQRHNGLMLVRR